MNFWNQSSTTTKVITVIVIIIVLAAVVYVAATLLASDTEPESEAVPTVMVPTPEPGSPSVTATTNVNIRTGPGTDYQVIGRLPQGLSTQALALSSDRQWVAIYVPGAPNNVGWVAAEFVSLTGEPYAVPTPSPGEPTVTATVNVNIRIGPGTENPIIGLMLANQTAKAIGKNTDGSWWAIDVPTAPSGEGWVSAEYVSTANTEGVAVLEEPGIEATIPPTITPTSEPDIEPTVEPTDETAGEGGPIPTPVPGFPAVTATADVRIRNGPSTDLDVVGLLKEGESAAALAISPDGGWVAIEINLPPLDVAWVSTDFVVSTGELIEIPQPAEGEPSVTATANVNIRTGPGIDYDRISLMLLGNKAGVVGISSDRLWWAINIPSVEDGRGWVSAEFVAAENAEDVPVILDY